MTNTEYLEYLKEMHYDHQVFLNKACFHIGGTLIFFLDIDKKYNTNSVTLDTWKDILYDVITSKDYCYITRELLDEEDEDVFNSLISIIEMFADGNYDSVWGKILIDVACGLQELFKEAIRSRLLDIVDVVHKIEISQ